MHGGLQGACALHEHAADCLCCLLSGASLVLQRGLYSQPSDVNGQQLMVPAQHSRHLPRRLGSRPASAAGCAAASAGPARTRGSNGSNAGGLGQKQQSARFPGVLQLAAVDAGAATDQQFQAHSPKGSFLQHVAAGGSSQGVQQQGLIPAAGSQPTTPRVIDGTPRAGAAAIPAPWLT